MLDHIRSQQNPNPYEFNKGNQLSRADDLEIKFAGVITRDDYMGLMPSKWFAWLGTVLTVLCAIMFVGGIVAVGVALAEGELAVLGAGVGLMSLGSTLGFFGFWASSNSLRANRTLKKYPYLLGAIEGSLLSEGVLFRHQDLTHWWGWGAIPRSVATVNGVRLQYSNNPLHYYAIGTRVLEQADWRGLSDILKSWIRKERLKVDATEPRALQRYAPFAKGCIQIRGPIQFSNPSRRQYLQMLAVEAISLSLFPLVLWLGIEYWIKLVLSLCVVFLVYSMGSKVRYLLFNRTIVDNMWGWLGPQQCILGVGQSGLVTSTNEMRLQSATDDMLHLIHTSGNQWYIARSLLVNMEQWDALLDLFTSK